MSNVRCVNDVGEGTFSGLLTGKQIKEYDLIVPIEDDNLQDASYDLTLGDRHYLYEDTGKWNAVFLGKSHDLIKANTGFSPGSPLELTAPRRGGGKLVIPPFGSAIVQLNETIDLRTVAQKKRLLIAGRFDLKLKSIYKGIISQQATQVEPCYKGKLYCFLHNLGSQEVILEMGEPLATIEFSFVGQGLGEKIRADIIDETIKKKVAKFENSKFSEPKEGITDIRWLYERNMLPHECGIAPIYNLVIGNVGEAVTKHLEKSDTIDRLVERVGNRLNEKQNMMKIVISLVATVITFFATSFLMNVSAELRYFSEELAFLGDSISGDVDPAILQAVEDHTSALEQLRQCQLIAVVVFSVIVVALLLILCFTYMRPRYEQKWEHKRRAMEAKCEYRQAKEQKKKGRKANDKKKIKDNKKSALGTGSE